MTACTNNGGKARRVVTAALVGVLSVGTVPMAALAAGVDGIQTMASTQDSWNNGTFEFDHEANADGSYTVTEGDTLSFVSGKDAAGNAIDPSDVTVLFFKRSTGVTTPSNPVLTSSSDATLDGRVGTMPSATADYWVYVFDGDVTLPANASGATTLSAIMAQNPGVTVSRYFLLTVAPKTDSVEGAVAYQGSSMSDTQFNYTGAGLTVNFKVGNTPLTVNDDYSVIWTSVPQGATEPAKTSGGYTVVSAGTYTAQLTGTGDYSGTATVTFEVKGIDLSSDAVSIAPSTSSFVYDASIGGLLKNNQIVANGTALDDNAELTAQLVAKNDNAIASSTLASYINAHGGNGKYTFRLTAKDGSKNVSGTCLVDAYVVNNTVTYRYNGDPVNAAFTTAFNSAKGTVFTPAALSADQIGGKDVDFTCKVTKDGKEVTSYTEPGTYTLTLDTPVTKDANGTYLYAGHEVVTFTVDPAKDYSGAKVYVSYDGKVLGSNVEYTGEAIAPTVVVRDKKNNLLTEGTDYTWKLVDAEGNEVESATNPGTYTVEVSYEGSTDATTEGVGSKKISFTIDKAVIDSVEPSADFFAIPEEGAAAPTFVGKTASGQEFALDASDISVRYYKTVDSNNDGKLDMNADSTYKRGAAVKAEDLTEVGTYVADVSILTTAANVKNPVDDLETLVTLSKNAVFTDVDANAWYAQVVAKAYSNYYVNGIANTNFFAPEAQITRADVACILYNMAGGNVKNGTVVGDDEFSFSDTDGYVTGFDDVDGHAYYAQAIAWAHASGVVNGYDGNFRPTDKVTREEFAAMLANFAKVKGDFEAPSADALDGVSDASTVSDWAKESVAWAVENGIMGNGGYVAGQSSIIRAEVAAMAVNYQPENLIDQTR